MTTQVQSLPKLTEPRKRIDLQVIWNEQALVVKRVLQQRPVAIVLLVHDQSDQFRIVKLVCTFHCGISIISDVFSFQNVLSATSSKVHSRQR